MKRKVVNSKLALASEFRTLYRRTCALRKAKKLLENALRKARIEVFDFGDGEVLIRERKKDKLASLKNLAEALGSEALAKTAWSRLPESHSSWYTIERRITKEAMNAKRKVITE